MHTIEKNMVEKKHFASPEINLLIKVIGGELANREAA
jgi:hypothetical protein